MTIRQFNLYADLLALIGAADPMLGSTPPHLDAVTIQARTQPEHWSRLDAWFTPMTLREPLPTLPIGLDVDLSVLLPLEPSYEEICRLPHIRCRRGRSRPEGRLNVERRLRVGGLRLIKLRVA